MSHDLGIRCDHFIGMAGGEARSERDVYLGIRDGRIAEISPWRGQSAGRFIHARNQVALPGLINGHTHLPMTLFRGLEDDLPFHKWLFERILPLEAKLVDAEFVRVGAELAALECIRFGTTTVCDMYYFSETVADVIDRCGMRALIGQVFLSLPTPEDRALGSDKTALFERLRSQYRGHDRIHATVSPHAPYTCDDETLKAAARLAEKHGAPINIHLCETEHEVRESLAKHGKTPVQRLFDLGVLQQRAICAHGVHVSEADMELMLQAGASVTYNPDSNLKLSSGIAPVTMYLKKGIPVSLGTDGSASNNDLSIFGAMDVGTKLQKLAAHDNTAMIAEQALRCATWDGARALGLLDRVGSLEPGKEADLILVDLDFPHLQPLYDLRSQLVYSAQGLEVDTVICRGRVLMEGKSITALDRERVLAEIAKIREKVVQAL